VEQAMGQGGRMPPPDFDAMGQDYIDLCPPLSDGISMSIVRLKFGDQ